MKLKIITNQYCKPTANFEASQIAGLFCTFVKIEHMAHNADTGEALIIQHITTGKRHKHYDHVVKLADQYKKVITGDNIGELLKKYAPRETDEMFDQRVELFQPVTPSVCEKIRSQFFRVGRVDNILEDIRFSKEIDQDKEVQLRASLWTFYGDQSLKSFMNTRFVDLSFVDPNAFILVDFLDFDNANEKAQPFPVEISSAEAINFSYINNKLEWLLVERDHLFAVKDGDKTVIKEGGKYFLYLRNEVVVMAEVDPHLLGGRQVMEVEQDGQSFRVVKVGDDRAFMVDVKEPKGGRVQAVRVGYKQDLVTDGKTFVSPIQPAMPRLLSSLKTKSELDLTMTLHTFPQKIQYTEKCDGESPQVGCVGGKNRSGTTCSVCNGSGKKVHTSSQDIMEFALPNDKDDMIDLSKIIEYKNPPIDLVKFQKEYSDQLEVSAMRDVFTQFENVDKAKFKTATENLINQDNVHDTLFPFTVQYSHVFEVLATMTGIFIDFGDVTVKHRFPKDFKLKGIEELLADLKAASEADAPVFVKSEIVSDIADKLYMDKPEKLREFAVKMDFLPFKSKTETEIAFARANGDLRRDDLILWANFEAIFHELVCDNPEFFRFAMPRQKELLKAKVAEFVDSIDNDTGTGASLLQPPTPPAEEE